MRPFLDATDTPQGAPWQLADPFVELCADVIARAYERLAAQGKPHATWLEETISQNLADAAEEVCLALDNHLCIEIESIEMTDRSLRGEQHTRTCQRKDICIRYATMRAMRGHYFAWEAKRVAAVDASLCRQYIDEGMMRFVRGEYSRRVNRAGMLGYVLSGSPGAAVAAVNKRISGGRKGLSAADTLTEAAACRSVGRWRSTHDRKCDSTTITVSHLFLPCFEPTDDEVAPAPSDDAATGQPASLLTQLVQFVLRETGTTVFDSACGPRIRAWLATESPTLPDELAAAAGMLQDEGEIEEELDRLATPHSADGGKLLDEMTT